MSYRVLHIATAKDLKGRDQRIYRFLEILPGALSWGTILAAVFFSWFKPVWMAVFIITFDVYWLIKTAYLMAHLRANWKKMRHNLKMDWQKKLENFRTEHIWQMILIPFYKEDMKIVEDTLEKILESAWPKEKIIVVLAMEARAGESAGKIARCLEEKYAFRFGKFLTTVHPAGLSGEISGKGSNIAWAAKKVKEEIIDTLKIPYENILVSAFDVDTQVYPQYFSCLAYHFLTADYPFRSSFQPVPLYNNNIWEAPALSRVVATSGSFWQMMQQERPERLVSFSSHSLSFKALLEAGYWQKNMVSEDSRIFWNLFFHYNGDYRIVPLSYPVSLDANVGENFWQTIKNIYKQQRRWTWGVENLPYLIFNCFKDKKISWRKKTRMILTQLEGYWSLPTNPLLIFFLGWLPIFLGGHKFNTTLLSYNLPLVTRALMIIAMSGLVVSAIISTSLLPPKPKHFGKRKYIAVVAQWLIIPVTIIFFGAIPGLDAQTRLLFGRYMGFWVTPKKR